MWIWEHWRSFKWAASNYILYKLFFSFSGIRHPEELSLMRKLEKEDLKKNTLIPVQHKRYRQKPPMSPYVDSPNSHNNSSNSLDFYSPHSNRSPQVCCVQTISLHILLLHRTKKKTSTSCLKIVGILSKSYSWTMVHLFH